MEVKEHPPPSFLHKDRPPVLLSHSGTSPVSDWEEPVKQKSFFSLETIFQFFSSFLPLRDS